MGNYLCELTRTFLLPAIVAVVVFLGFSVVENIVGGDNIPYPAIVAGWTYGVVYYRPLERK